MTVKITIILFCVFISSVNAQNTFQKKYENLLPALSKSIIQTSDDEYVILGNTNTLGAGDWDGYLIKINGNGDTIWTRTYGDSTYNSLYNIDQTQTGGFILTGQQTSYAPYITSMWVLNTDGDGIPIWSKTYILSSEYGFQVKQANDGGFIIGGLSWNISDDACLWDLMMVKINEDGDPLWVKGYCSGALGNIQINILNTSDGGYLLTGNEEQTTGGMYLVKTDSNGDTLWTKAYAGYDWTWIVSIQQTMDDGYIILGNRGGCLGPKETELIKLDELGNLMWSKVYGGKINDVTTSLSGANFDKTEDGGYIILAGFDYGGPSVPENILIKTNSSGEIIWTKDIGPTGISGGWQDIIQTSDNGFLFTGNSDANIIKTNSSGESCNASNKIDIFYDTFTFHQETFPIFLSDSSLIVTNVNIKVGSGGSIDAICETTAINNPLTAANKFTIFPNPAKNYFTIRSNDPINRACNFEIFNVQGIKIYTGIINNAEVTISTKSFAPGIYFVKGLEKDKNSFGTKMVIVE